MVTLRWAPWMMLATLATACADDGGADPSGSSGSTTATTSPMGTSAPSTSVAADTSSSTGGADTTSTSTASAGSSDTSGGSSYATATSSSSGDASSGSSSSSSDGSSSSGPGDEGPVCMLPDDSSDGGDGGTPLDLGVDGGCGNGVVEGDEVCDDGNAVGGDGCEVDCTSSDDVQPEFSFTIGSGLMSIIDTGTGVVFDSQNNLIVSGSVGHQIWIRKYDPEYVELWTVTYDADPDTIFVPVAIDSNDNIAFTGPIGATPNADWLFGLLDPDGMELWTQTFDGAASLDDRPRDVTVDGDDAVIVVGSHGIAMGHGEAAVLKYTNDGALLWSAFFEGGNDTATVALAVDTDPCDAILLTGGWFTNDTQLVAVTRKYDTDGGLVWEQTDDTPLTDWALDVGADAWGRVVVTGWKIDPLTYYADFWLRQYDADGVEQWTRLEDGGASLTDVHNAGVVAANGDSWSVGKLTVNEYIDLAVIRHFDPSGTLVYSRGVDLGGMDAWLAVDRAPDGRIGVAGVYALPSPSDSEAVFAVFPP